MIQAVEYCRVCEKVLSYIMAIDEDEVCRMIPYCKKCNLVHLYLVKTVEEKV